MPLGHSCRSATFWTRPFGDTDGSKKPKAGRGHLQIGGSRSNPAEHLMATRLRYPRSLKTLCDSMGLVLPKIQLDHCMRLGHLRRYRITLADAVFVLPFGPSENTS